MLTSWSHARREQGAVLSDEQNRNEMVAAAGKRAPGKKVAGKAETTMREREREKERGGDQGLCRTVVMSCPVESRKTGRQPPLGETLHLLLSGEFLNLRNVCARN